MSARATVHAVGLVVGLAGGFALVVSGGSAIAPPVFAGSFLIAVVLGQIGRARPELVSDQQPGLIASLRVRRMRDYVPKSLARAALACAAVAIGGFGTILALGRYAKDLPDGYYPHNFGGPFSEAGKFGGIGIVGLLASTWVTVTATVIVGAFSLWLVARSPRVVGDADLIRRDERWRQDQVLVPITGIMGMGSINDVNGISGLMSIANPTGFSSGLPSIHGPTGLSNFASIASPTGLSFGTVSIAGPTGLSTGTFSIAGPPPVFM